MKLDSQQKKIAGVAFIGGAAFVFLLFCFVVGEWKPSGDGVTIVNTRTGELRYTRTGKRVKPPVEQTESNKSWNQDPVVQSDANRNKWGDISLSAEEAEAAEEKSFRDRYDLIKNEWDKSGTIPYDGNTINDLKIYAHQHSLESELALIDHWKAQLEARNAEIFQYLKDLATKYPDVLLGPYLAKGRMAPPWEQVTRPLRLQTQLTEDQRAALLAALGRAAGLKEYSSNAEFSSAIQKLKQYDPAANGWTLQELTDIDD